MNASTQASARCSFQLTYARSARKRTLGPALIVGDDVPCAYQPDRTQPGDWENGMHFPDGSKDQNEWVDHYASMAINEAVHEALEWFQVDGKPWLNPHGSLETAIYDLVNKLAEDLAALRRRADDPDPAQ